MISTLLGPEGTTVSLRFWGVGLLFRNCPGMAWSHIPCGRADLLGLCSWWLVWGCGVVGWLLVENCTVDASILFSVVKLSRANGGCLGTRSR